MDYTTENLDKMRLVGFETKIENSSNKTKIIQNFWTENFQNGYIQSLMEENNATQNQLLGVSYNIKADGSFDYFIGIESDKPAKENFKEINIKASKYIVVKCSNSEIGNTFDKLFSNISNSEYSVDDVGIEFYKVDGECEIYLAVK